MIQKGDSLMGEVKRRALDIAAGIMEEAGVCTLDDQQECDKDIMDMSCQVCIRKWLMDKARKELAREKEPRACTK